MRVTYADKSDCCVIVLDNQSEAGTFINILAAAMTGKPLNKRSKAYKMAQTIDDELPTY